MAAYYFIQEASLTSCLRFTLHRKSHSKTSHFHNFFKHEIIRKSGDHDLSVPYSYEFTLFPCYFEDKKLLVMTAERPLINPSLSYRFGAAASTRWKCQIEAIIFLFKRFSIACSKIHVLECSLSFLSSRRSLTVNFMPIIIFDASENGCCGRRRRIRPVLRR